MTEIVFVVDTVPAPNPIHLGTLAPILASEPASPLQP